MEKRAQRASVVSACVTGSGWQSPWTNEGLQDNLMRDRRFIRARELEKSCQILIELDFSQKCIPIWILFFILQVILCLVNDRWLFYSNADLPLHQLRCFQFGVLFFSILFELLSLIGPPLCELEVQKISDESIIASEYIVFVVCNLINYRLFFEGFNQSKGKW